jgi:hypothetical protein
MRLEVRQRLPEHLASLSEEGWLESFTKTTVRSTFEPTRAIGR